MHNNGMSNQDRSVAFCVSRSCSICSLNADRMRLINVNSALERFRSASIRSNFSFANAGFALITIGPKREEDQ